MRRYRKIELKREIIKEGRVVILACDNAALLFGGRACAAEEGTEGGGKGNRVSLIVRDSTLVTWLYLSTPWFIYTLYSLALLGWLGQNIQLVINSFYEGIGYFRFK